MLGSFELGHEGLPGTNWEARIEYSVEAELEMPGLDFTLSVSLHIIIIICSTDFKSIKTLVSGRNSIPPVGFVQLHKLYAKRKLFLVQMLGELEGEVLETNPGL